jgi:hypothetical protein
VTLEDGSTRTAYKIDVFAGDRAYISPLLTGGAFYYSPDKKFIARLDLSALPTFAGEVGTMGVGGLGGIASLGTLVAVTEQEAKDAIARMGPAKPDIVLFAGVAGIIILIVLAILLIKSRRTSLIEMSEFETGAPPAAPEEDEW